MNLEMYKLGCETAFEKLGITLPQARKAYGALKKYIIKAKMLPDFPTIGIAKKFPKAEVAQLPPTPAFTLLPEESGLKKPIIGLFGSQTKELPLLTKKIFGKSHSFPAAIKKLKTPHEKEMFNRIIGLHEGAELGAFRRGLHKKYFGPVGGHRAPTVLLHESNILATLPKKYKNVQEAMLVLRDNPTDIGVIEAFKLIYPGFEYGKTRLPRSAVKHIENYFQKLQQHNIEKYFQKVQPGKLPAEELEKFNEKLMENIIDRLHYA